MTGAPEQGVRHVEVAPDDDGVRVDRWFKRHFPDVPYGQLAKWLRTGQVRVDGSRAKPGGRLSAGQQLRLPPMSPAAEPRTRTAKPVDDAAAAELRERVLYRDDHLIAINKPAGLAVQGGTRTTRHLDGMLDALRFDAPDRPRLVHRLDKDTSGLLILARTRQAARALSVEFQGRTMEKVYWALVLGVPDIAAGTIDMPLSKQGEPGGERMGHSHDGQDAETDYRILEQAAQRLAWLELRPRTGRTHQLRAHCAAMGNPILGDGKYGGRDSFLPGLPKRLHLHARALTLSHPDTGARLELTAPLDPELAESWKKVGFASEMA
ncbi:MAG: RluA family pseudouridine synthase [Alphaproteobacteria bacterium]|nr:RluA family pseudouridine synthase [Alphaproteobacteria bacterium]